MKEAERRRRGNFINIKKADTVEPLSTMAIHDGKTHPSTPIPKDITDLIRRLYDCLDDASRINEFAEIFTADGTLKVQGKIFQGTQEILQGQTLATAGGSWRHTVDTIYPFGSGDQVEWLMINLHVEMTPHGEGRPKRDFESAARIQIAREAGQARVKYLQVYTYIPENEARLA